MSSPLDPKRSFGPLWLRALMLAALAVGLLFGLGKLVGIFREELNIATYAPIAPPTEWMLVSILLSLGIMVAFAARFGSLHALVQSRESFSWHGAALLLVAGFFQSYRGPWGVGVSYYSLFTWHLEKFGTSLISITWTMFFGAILLVMSYWTIVSKKPRAYRWRWVVVGLSLILIAACFLTIALREGVGLNPQTRAVSLAIAIFLLVSIAGVGVFLRSDRRKAHALDMIASLALLGGLDPRSTINGRTAPFLDALLMTGPGYWLEALGAIVILVGAVACMKNNTSTQQ